jgi:cbb3-type cytochrome oxidase subunit 3
VDTAIYLATAAITIVWAVWTYLLWADRAGLPEDSSMRFLLIVGPTVFFIVTALAGLDKILYLRLDIIGILALDCLALVCLLFLVVVFYILRRRSARAYRFILLFYFVTAAFITAFSHLIKFSPTMLLMVYGWIQQAARMDFFKFAWVGLNAQSGEADLVGMLNKIVIAVLSYVPIAMVRFIYSTHQRKKFHQQIDELRDRIDSLEKKQ